MRGQGVARDHAISIMERINLSHQNSKAVQNRRCQLFFKGNKCQWYTFYEYFCQPTVTAQSSLPLSSCPFLPTCLSQQGGYLFAHWSQPRRHSSHLFFRFLRRESTAFFCFLRHTLTSNPAGPQPKLHYIAAGFSERRQSLPSSINHFRK